MSDLREDHVVKSPTGLLCARDQPDEVHRESAVEEYCSVPARGDTMRVFFVASEALPYVKTGGLGDVTGSLPSALTRYGSRRQP